MEKTQKLYEQDRKVKQQIHRAVNKNEIITQWLALGTENFINKDKVRDLTYKLTRKIVSSIRIKSESEIYF